MIASSMSYGPAANVENDSTLRRSLMNMRSTERYCSKAVRRLALLWRKSIDCSVLQNCDDVLKRK